MRSLITVFASGVFLLAAGCEYESRSDRMSSDTTVKGEHGERLSIHQPKDQDIRRGATETVTIRLQRSNISGPIRVTFSQLPSGVEAVDAPRETESDKIEVVLRARENADLVSNQRVLVTAEGPDNIRATESFNLTVKEQA